MAHDDQARDQDDRGNTFSRTDSCSIASSSFSSSEEGSLVSDGDEDDKGGHINLVMSDLLNQPLPASVNITNSSDVRIGPTLHYNGPVTINQYLNLQHPAGSVEGLQSIQLPDGTGKGVLSGVAASGVGTCTDTSKRSGGDSADAGGAPWWRQPKVLGAAGALVVLLAVVGTMMALLWPGAGDEAPTTSSRRSSSRQEKDPEFVLEDGRQIIRRARWASEPPAFIRPLHHPTPYVVIGHTAGTACQGESECFPLLSAYAYEHRTNFDQPDIAYNFLIDVAGNIYEGRGWDATNNFQSWATRCNLGVSLMGDFRYHNVTQAMAQSLQQLLQLGVKLGKLDPEYRLVAHNQLLATLSPGKKVLDLMETLPHRCMSNCNVGVNCTYEGPE